MSIKLVIVDDAPFIRESLKEVIRGTEFVCVGEADNGKEAIKIIEKLRPDVVLLDLVLPEMNGIEVATVISQQHAEICIVACSTENQKEMAILALQAGCKDFLRKPFTKSGVLDILRKSTGSKAPYRAKKSG